MKGNWKTLLMGRSKVKGIVPMGVDSEFGKEVRVVNRVAMGVAGGEEQDKDDGRERGGCRGGMRGMALLSTLECRRDPLPYTYIQGLSKRD